MASQKKQPLEFTVHDLKRGLTCTLPVVGDYQKQKQIRVVTSAPLNFGNATNNQQTSELFITLRLRAALSLDSSDVPCYFPGKVIPGQGGSTCAEITRGNLLFEQFCHMLNFDHKCRARLLDNEGQYSLYSMPVDSSDRWSWTFCDRPRLSFLYQALESVQSGTKVEIEQALQALSVKISKMTGLYTLYGEVEDLESALTEIKAAWYQGQGNTTSGYGTSALQCATQLFNSHRHQITAQNLLPFMFELEAIASQVSASQTLGLHSFAAGVFADNYVQVSLMPLSAIKATEFCVRERLFDEIINLAGRGFAPVVINEWGLVADGNHRVTAAWIWNLLKYTASQNWSLDDKQFQFKVAQFIREAKESNVSANGSGLSAISEHEILSHLSAYLQSPEYRSRLLTYIKPLLSNHDYIQELPVVLLSEYLSQAVVKELYDMGLDVVRACPSLYEEMSRYDDLVLPPRASYHFTDAALLPWFTVLTNSQCESQKDDLLRARRIPASARKQKNNKQAQNKLDTDDTQDDKEVR